MESTNAASEERKQAAEWEVRCKLAMAYRIAHFYGWDQLIFNHITAKVPGSEVLGGGPHFLINPFGVRFDEITASSLLKVTLGGDVVQDGSKGGVILQQGYVIHSAIHEAREDLGCIWHCHHADSVAICMTKDGLLPLSQEAIMTIPDVAYHPFEGTTNSVTERPRIAASLGRDKYTLLLQNHGPVTGGACIEDAFKRMFVLCRATTYQQKVT
jgi:ribulose-5-phosphate 4-epimerase/fuculose-1-phosphate aldolase